VAGFAACKLAGKKLVEDPEGGGELPPDALIHFSKSEGIIFNDDPSFELEVKLLDGILSITDLSWEVVPKGIVDISGDIEKKVVAPTGNTGEVTITARLTPKDSTLDLGNLHLSAEYKLTVLSIPTLSISSFGEIMLQAGNQPNETQVNATHTPDFSIYNPSFDWSITEGASYAELIKNGGPDVMLKAVAAGSGKLKAIMTVLGKTIESSEAAFKINPFDATKQPHNSITITNAPSSIIATDTSGEFQVSFQPATASYDSIKWEYDTGKLVLNYNKTNGKLTIQAKAGSASAAPYTVKASSMLAAGVEDSFFLTVNPVTVTVAAAQGKSDAISKGEKTVYTATVNAQNKAVNWSFPSGAEIKVEGGEITNTKSVAASKTISVKATSAADTSVFGAKDVTLNPPKYKLTYDKNASPATGTMASETKTFGQKYALTENKFVNQGLVFGGWNTSNNGGGTNYSDKQADVDIDPLVNNDEIKLYAQWKVKVSYNGNGNTGGSVPAEQIVSPGSNLTLATQGNLVKSGGVFEGWNTASDGSGQSYSAGATYTISSGLTLYAKWNSSFVAGQENNPDLMVKFGVKAPGGYALSSITAQDVTDTFKKVSGYIQTQSPSNVNPSGGLGVVKIGDYVDLASLKVDAYNSNGGAIANGSAALVNKELTGHGTLLRVMVVGINSYYGKNSNQIMPHLIFQFQNTPSKARIHSALMSEYNYNNTDMHNYLNVNYWKGLKDAGVPESEVVTLTRKLSGKSSSYAALFDIKDKLFLPSLIEAVNISGNCGEGYLETHDNNGVFVIPSIKYDASNTAVSWSTASGSSGSFAAVSASGSYDWRNSDCSFAITATKGIAPAFAIGGIGGLTSPITVSFDTNGGTGTAPADVTGQSGWVIKLPSDTGLSKTGYNFGGWNTIQDGSGTNYDAGANYTLSANVKLYANWLAPDLMVKFKVKSIGYKISSIKPSDVTETFNKVSAYVKTQSASSANPANGLGIIRMGDYVNLPSLKVDAYNNNGGAIDLTNTDAGNDKLRVMVVGINSHYYKNDNGAKPHIVFMFKDPPGTSRVNPTDENKYGYLNSDVRKYLVPATGTGSGKFLSGLIAAGVPKNAMWNLDRRGANKSANKLDVIRDILWLPTLYEIGGAGESGESSSNQGRLGYFTSNEVRKKSSRWWTASPRYVDTRFMDVEDTGNAGGFLPPTYVNGIIPAFAVSGDAASFKLSYSVNGGSGNVPNEVSVTAGSSITLPASAGLSKTGCTFGGWNAEPDGSGQTYAGGSSFTMFADVTFYAMWSYTITYNKNEGTGTEPAPVPVLSHKKSVKLDSGTTLSFPRCTLAWNTKADGTGSDYWPGYSYTFEGNTTLYAKWNHTTTESSPGNKTWTAPADGYYTIEVYGAQGANATQAGPSNNLDYGDINDYITRCRLGRDGGKGGYSKGEKIALKAGDVITLKVGAQGGGGAGAGVSTAKKGGKSGAAGAGGGMSAALNGTTTLIIAGGGGGAGGEGAILYGNAYGTRGGLGGAGGGYNADGTDGGGMDACGGRKATAAAHGAGGKNAANSDAAGSDAGPGRGTPAEAVSDGYYAAGGGGGGGAGYKNGGGGGKLTLYGADSLVGHQVYSVAGGGGGGGSGYAKTGSGGFAKASGQAGVQSGNGKIVVTRVF
jgi:hypothetical protein